jgi:hypothetical protein
MYLQCAIPAFDKLMPEPHNTIICRLLSVCAEWQALAKLRMHTEETVQKLEATTVTLSNRFRNFVNTTCSAFKTMETPKEFAARVKRASKAPKTNDSLASTAGVPLANDTLASIPALPRANDTLASIPALPRTNDTLLSTTALPGAGFSTTLTTPTPQIELPEDGTEAEDRPSVQVTGKIRKTFNLNTYKYHALADYPSTIRRFGTTDSYSTERVISTSLPIRETNH